MHLQRALPSQLRLVKRALRPSAMAVGFALGLGACAGPSELTPGAISGARLAPWQAQLTLTLAADRRLSDGEGEVVVAAAIAAHEMRRP
jgi:hypothetical protein